MTVNELIETFNASIAAMNERLARLDSIDARLVRIEEKLDLAAPKLRRKGILPPVYRPTPTPEAILTWLATQPERRATFRDVHRHYACNGAELRFIASKMVHDGAIMHRNDLDPPGKRGPKNQWLVLPTVAATFPSVAEADNNETQEYSNG